MLARRNIIFRFSKKIFPDFWPQATLNPARSASQFSSLSSLPRLFAIQKSNILRKQCENSENNAKTPLNYNYFLRFSAQIFPDFWPQATPHPPHAQRANFRPISPLSHLFAIQKSIKLRKQCGNSENNAKTSLNYNYFLRFSTKIFPDFWPQAASQNRPQAKHPTPSPRDKKTDILNRIICTFAAQGMRPVSCKEQGDAAGSAGSPGLRRTSPGAPLHCHFLRMQGGISDFVD